MVKVRVITEAEKLGPGGVVGAAGEGHVGVDGVLLGIGGKASALSPIPVPLEYRR